MIIDEECSRSLVLYLLGNKVTCQLRRLHQSQAQPRIDNRRSPRRSCVRAEDLAVRNARTTSDWSKKAKRYKKSETNSNQKNEQELK
jgi:hypothetical protein